MTTHAIETRELTFRFGAEPVLRGVDLTVPHGSIYGFLGPNGAGKTTTLRLLLGLLRKQQGSIEIFRKNFESERLDILKRLGSLIEQPSLYAHLTAKENLEVYRRIYGSGKNRIDEVLQLVGLTYTK